MGFFTIHSVAKHQKLQGWTLLGKIFPEEKSHNGEKNLKADPLVWPSIVSCAEKKEKPNLF